MSRDVLRTAVAGAIALAGAGLALAGDGIPALAGVAGVAVAIVALAAERLRRGRRIDELSRTLQDLIAQVITAEETERARVADLLHDDVQQLLLVTRHDITDALEGDRDALPRAGDGIDLATRHLRQTIQGLRSEGVAAHRLGDGLAQLGRETAQRRGCAVVVDVAGELRDEHHPLVLSLGRDLLREIERRSTATTIELQALTDGPDLVLAVRHDDPRYVRMPPADGAEDPLAAVDQRARAVGGRLTAERDANGSRRLTVVVPRCHPARLAASPRSTPSAAGAVRALRPWPSRAATRPSPASTPTPTARETSDVQPR